MAPAAALPALLQDIGGDVLACAATSSRSFEAVAAGAVPAAGAIDGNVPAGGTLLSPRAMVIGVGAARLGTPVGMQARYGLKLGLGALRRGRRNRGWAWRRLPWPITFLSMRKNNAGLG